MSHNFTEKAENALARAVKLAEGLGHTYIGSEHLLLAIAEDKGSLASVILCGQGIKSEDIDKSLRERSGVGHKSTLSARDTTPRCRKILEASYKNSRKLAEEKIGTEHMLFFFLFMPSLYRSSG